MHTLANGAFGPPLADAYTGTARDEDADVDGVCAASQHKKQDSRRNNSHAQRKFREKQKQLKVDMQNRMTQLMLENAALQNANKGLEQQVAQLVSQPQRAQQLQWSSCEQTTTMALPEQALCVAPSGATAGVPASKMNLVIPPLFGNSSVEPCSPISSLLAQLASPSSPSPGSAAAMGTLLAELNTQLSMPFAAVGPGLQGTGMIGEAAAAIMRAHSAPVPAAPQAAAAPPTTAAAAPAEAAAASVPPFAAVAGTYGGVEASAAVGGSCGAVQLRAGAAEPVQPVQVQDGLARQVWAQYVQQLLGALNAVEAGADAATGGLEALVDGWGHNMQRLFRGSLEALVGILAKPTAPEGLWRLITGMPALKLSIYQKRCLTDALRHYMDSTAAITSQRRELSSRLLACVPTRLNTLQEACEYNTDAERCLGLLEANIKKEQTALADFTGELFMQVLTKPQLAKLTVTAWPHFPDALAVAAAMLNGMQQEALLHAHSVPAPYQL